jgi:hypothetical protein
MTLEYPKGYKENKTVVVERELWNRFKKKVTSKGLTMTFVLMGLIKEYLERENSK